MSQEQNIINLMNFLGHISYKGWEINEQNSLQENRGYSSFYGPKRLSELEEDLISEAITTIVQLFIENKAKENNLDLGYLNIHSWIAKNLKLKIST